MCFAIKGSAETLHCVVFQPNYYLSDPLFILFSCTFLTPGHVYLLPVAQYRVQKHSLPQS